MREFNILANEKALSLIRKKLDDVVYTTEDTSISVSLYTFDNNYYINIKGFERDLSEYVLADKKAYDDEEDNALQALFNKVSDVIIDDDSDIALASYYIGDDLIDMEEESTSLASTIFVGASIIRKFTFNSINNIKEVDDILGLLEE